MNRKQRKVAELKRKIGDLEGHIQQIENENSLLREYNGIFDDKNKALQEKLDQCQIWIPRSLTQQGGSTKRPSKRFKSKEKSPKEGNEAAARVRIISQKFAT